MPIESVIFAFCLTLFAGLSTGIGSVLAFFTSHTNKRFLSVSLGFSAGVMLYISFTEIFNTSNQLLIKELGAVNGSWLAVICFFGGIGISALIDKLVPSFENPHEIHQVEEINDQAVRKNSQKLMRIGAVTAFAIAIHNFPEGMITFMGALKDPNLGIALAVAIAIHNIPEGIAVSVPIYFSSGSKTTAFKYSFISGIAEPVGAIIGYLLLLPILNDTVFGIVLASVAGIMVFISLDQLLPTAREYGEHHLSIYGLILGMAIMAVSLILFL